MMAQKLSRLECRGRRKGKRGGEVKDAIIIDPRGELLDEVNYRGAAKLRQGYVVGIGQ